MSRLPIIADLRECEQGLDIWCCNYECRRHEYLTPAQAEELVGVHLTFAEASRLLSCSRCGARGRDGMIEVRGSMIDYYAHILRERQAREVKIYGTVQTVGAPLPQRPRYGGPMKRL